MPGTYLGVVYEVEVAVAVTAQMSASAFDAAVSTALLTALPAASPALSAEVLRVAARARAVAQQQLRCTDINTLARLAGEPVVLVRVATPDARAH